MKIFTYREYIKCIHTFRLNAVMQLAEESVEYQLEGSNKKDTEEGEEIKKILQNKEEVSELINQFLDPREKIKKGSNVLMLRQAGGQKYVIIDTL